jgi:twinkle protein
MRRFALKNCDVKGGNRLEEAEEWMDRHFMISTFPDDKIPDLEDIKQEIETAVLHHDCNIFVLDPWNELDHDMQRMSETQYIEKSLVAIKKMARKYGIIIIVIAHPTKLKDREADLYSISGSANWKNKCDHGVVVKRNVDEGGKLTNVSTIVIEKCKDHETMGEPGSVIATFNRMICDYEFGDTSIYIPQEHEEVENIGHYTKDE